MDNYAIYTPEYFTRPTIEYEYFSKGELRPDQEVCVKYTHRDGTAISIGCGLGILESELAKQGVLIYGLDLQDFRFCKNFPFIQGNLDRFPDWDFRTVIFCESIEHIAEEEFERNWPRIVASLRRTEGRLIISNWAHYHPLEVNGWDHIRRIDDSLYDRFAAEAKQTVYRNGSQLVLDF